MKKNCACGHEYDDHDPQFMGDARRGDERMGYVCDCDCVAVKTLDKDERSDRWRDPDDCEWFWQDEAWHFTVGPNSSLAYWPEKVGQTYRGHASTDDGVFHLNPGQLYSRVSAPCELERLREAVAAVRSLHWPSPDRDSTCDCVDGLEACPTIAALDAALGGVGVGATAQNERS